MPDLIDSADLKTEKNIINYQLDEGVLMIIRDYSFGPSPMVFTFSSYSLIEVSVLLPQVFSARTAMGKW